MTAKTKTTVKASSASRFWDRALVGWLWIYLPVLVLNQFVDFPGLNDNAVSLAGGLACLGLVFLARGTKTTTTRAPKPQGRR